MKLSNVRFSILFLSLLSSQQVIGQPKCNQPDALSKNQELVRDAAAYIHKGITGRSTNSLLYMMERSPALKFEHRPDLSAFYLMSTELDKAAGGESFLSLGEGQSRLVRDLIFQRQDEANWKKQYLTTLEKKIKTSPSDNSSRESNSRDPKIGDDSVKDTDEEIKRIKAAIDGGIENLVAVDISYPRVDLQGKIVDTRTADFSMKAGTDTYDAYSVERVKEFPMNYRYGVFQNMNITNSNGVRMKFETVWSSYALGFVMGSAANFEEGKLAFNKALEHLSDTGVMIIYPPPPEIFNNGQNSGAPGDKVSTSYLNYLKSLRSTNKIADFNENAFADQNIPLVILGPSIEKNPTWSYQLRRLDKISDTK